MLRLFCCLLAFERARDVERITIDVGSRIQEYMCTSPSPPPPPNKYEKLHNLDFNTFSKTYKLEKNY